MRTRKLLFTFGLMVAVLAAGLLTTGSAFAQWGPAHGSRGSVVVADRASGTISVISTRTDELLGTYALPEGTATPEPMYVVYSPMKNRVFVGDRANNRVVVFKARDFSVETTVDAGAGVFHMWGERRSRQLWVNNDIDNTSTVIDLRTLDVLATVPMPADLVAMGGKPHDVILDPDGDFAYVSMVGFAGDDDYLVKFSTESFDEVARTAVGKDPHVSLNRWSDVIYVPCQNSDVVLVLDRSDLSLVETLAVPGAHGAGMSRNGLFFYTTNLPGAGVDALYTIFTPYNVVIGDPTPTPFPVPHNLALTPNNKKLYVTHSGDSDKVTVYTMDGFLSPFPVYETEITVGMNPFGLSYVP